MIWDLLNPIKYDNIRVLVLFIVQGCLDTLTSVKHSQR